MAKKRYKFFGTNDTVKVSDLSYDKIKGYQIEPKNNVSYDGILVNKAIIVKPSFIEELLKKKNKRKLDYYLNFLANIVEDDDSDDESIDIALDDISRYKSIIHNNYRQYLKEQYVQALIKKLDVLELELKRKQIVIEPVMEEKSRKSR